MSLLKELAEEFNQDTILFIGSGVSIPSGLPSWSKLLSWLKDYTNDLGGNVSLADEFLKDQEFLKSASELTSELEKLDKSLVDFFSDSRCDIFRTAIPQDIHRLIASLPTSSLITPNYDILLEKTFEAEGYDLQVVHKGEGELLNSIVRGKLKNYIYKYHGCITKPEKIVLDIKDYTNQKYSNSHDMEALKTLIHSKTFVFIGAGLEDPDLIHIRDNLINTIGSSNIEFWAFMSNCDKKVKFYQQHYGIKLISYFSKEGDHSDLLNKIQDLLTEISELDKRKFEAVDNVSSKATVSNITQGVLKETLLLANEEIMPLDEQILGFVAFFDTIEKEQCYKYLHEYKGNDLGEIINRIAYLTNRNLLKTTDNFLLNIKANYSIEAAEHIEDDIMGYLMETNNG
ncbi:SIR2 family protein [Vibrio parahaemolyticus]